MAEANDFTTPTGSAEPQSPLTESSASTAENGIQEGMAHPPSSTAAQAEATADRPVPLPPVKPKRKTIRVDRLERDIKVLDRLAYFLLLVLAFFLGSFAIQNSDTWMHLATGRSIARGGYTFGENPYSNPPTPYWANHSWLFDVTIYGLASLGGGIDAAAGQAILVIFKALLIVALAWVLLRLRRPDQSLWVPILCVGLALLAMSPRLVFQSHVLSYVFLAVTLLLLVKSQGRDGGESQAAPAQGFLPFFRRKPLWLLPLVFILWVNLDDWYILGPITVGFFLLGELLQALLARLTERRQARRPGHAGSMALVFVVGLLVCLVSPYHYHGFTLPTELSYLVVSVAKALGVSDALPAQLADAGRTFDALVQLPRGADELTLSPVNARYFVPEIGLNAAGLAYFCLLLASLGSFMLLLGRWSWARLLIWLFFTGLSLVQTRMIPFFAVVAGPIAALNFQEFIASAFGARARVDGPWVVVSLIGRFATVLGALVLLALAWPGLLHASPDDPEKTHRVAWCAEANAFQKETALQLREVRERSDLGSGFNIDPYFANYSAWYCPGEKTYFDFRFELFADRIDDWMRCRQTLPLTHDQLKKVQQKQRTWLQIFREGQIDHLVLAERYGYGSSVIRCWADPRQFPQPDLGTLSMIFGWKDPKNPRENPLFQGRSPDLDALAFAPGTTDRAPDRGIDFEPEPPEFLTRYWKSRPGLPWDTVQASLYQNYQHPVSSDYDAYLIAQSLGMGNGVLVGLGAGLTRAHMQVLSGLMNGYSYNLSAFVDQSPYRRQVIANRFQSKSAPILAVRAARRAIAASPNDAICYRNLALAYQSLWKRQEDIWSDLALGEVHAFMMRDYGSPGEPRRPGTYESVSWIKEHLAPPPLQEKLRPAIRQAQIVAAYHRALALQPSLWDVHQALYRLYLGQLHFYDAASFHLGEAIKHYKAAVPTRWSNEKAEDFDNRRKGWGDQLDQMEEEYKRLSREVADRLKDYRFKASNQPLGKKLSLAVREEYRVDQKSDPLGRGLALEALKTLKNAKNREVSIDIFQFQLQIKMLLGRLDDLDGFRADMRDLKEQLGRMTELAKKQPSLIPNRDTIAYTYSLFGLYLAAIDGDYREADRILKILEKAAQIDQTRLLQLSAMVLQITTYYDLLQNQPFVRAAARNEMGRYSTSGLRAIAGPLSRAAELHLERGLLALEHGDDARAAEEMRAVVHYTRDLNSRDLLFSDRAIAEEYLKVLEREASKAKARPKK